MSILAGNMQHLHIGAEYEVTATLEYNAKYRSYQYKPITIVSTVPKTTEQQKTFLMSIVTPKQAETLLEKYPNIVMDIIKGRDDVDLTQLKGIGAITYNNIREKIIDNYIISDILVLLQPLGINYSTIKRLLSNEPNPILLKQKLIEDPYILLKYRGFGFKTVDSLALKLNPPLKDSTTRTYALLRYYLTDIGNSQGHTWVLLDNLETIVRNYAPECIDKYFEIINDEKENPSFLHIEGQKVGLFDYWVEETEIYQIVQELNDYDPLGIIGLNVERGIEKAEKDQGFEYTQEQIDIIRKSLKHNFTIIAGSAGTGKSSISRGLLNIYADADYKITCCALSAKAAQRITEATGFPASTIHRLLGFDGGGGGFVHSHENPISTDVLLIDECSMINSNVFYHLLNAVEEGTKVIMCGDNRQLPPIGYGNIFGDLLLKSDRIHVLKLTKVLRQAEKSGILSDANKIRKGEYPIVRPDTKIVTGELKDMFYAFRDNKAGLQELAIKTYLKSINEDGLDEVVIITPRREKCDNSATEINIKLSDLLLDKSGTIMKYGRKEFMVGSKVMQIDNNYEKNVFNGEVGYITEIREATYDGEKNIEFDVRYKLGNQVKTVTYNKSELEQLDLAYAMTCHKAQGSGYKTAIVVIDMTHYTLLDTCLLYTAITRAKKRCLLLAEPKAFQTCMTNNKSKNRQTWLKSM